MPKTEQSLIDQITSVKDRYFELKEIIDDEIIRGEDSDQKPEHHHYFAELIQIRKELSCLSFDLAKQCGKAFREKGKAKTKLDITRYLKQKQFMASGVKVTAAEALAKQETTELLQNESDREGDYMSDRLILNQVNEILASVKQDISIVKKEYESLSDRE